ncbi:hypothetical protein NC651_016272 [Populus alba x Populus x berolinensis]|uniref:Uncharacterized protein n=1 Tax=Populus alba x Populus x berolinensis TaxID=444605 RepID=A0AAD6W023_9ROSI|nr:hypothetical protein NC651_016272 [Populus alba x Populus x berolinensis]KAJ6993676.1 hypothetical protein NC653_016727 [Populus alba x Populus x berolinensis]
MKMYSTEVFGDEEADDEDGCGKFQGFTFCTHKAGIHSTE